MVVFTKVATEGPPRPGRTYDHLDDVPITIKQALNNPVSAIPVAQRIANIEERIQNDKAFSIYDKNQDGFVTKNEVLQFSGGSLTKEQVGKLYAV